MDIWEKMYEEAKKLYNLQRYHPLCTLIML